MGVISDFDVRLLGIDSYFKFVVQSLVEGYSKPSKELWQVALRNAQMAEGEEEGYHIGDDPKKDAFTDATTIIVDRENVISTTFTRISTLEELPDLLNVNL
jgi:FMN phosphatase YigB (HAD superfamily)